MIRVLTLCACLAPATLAQAQDLALPGGARLLSERISPLASYNLPVGTFGEGRVPSLTLEGRIERYSWRISGGSWTPLQILSPLRERIAEAGYDILLDCEAADCGGFDFRFGTEVIPAPDMYVAIRDYRFLSAVKGEAAVSLLISRNAPEVYVQIIRVSPPNVDTPPVQVTADPEPATPSDPSGLIDRLRSDGRVILDDLDFGTGADALGPGPFATLSEMAALLNRDPDKRIALVGHTDTVGSLSNNMALGKRRADAVRDRLVKEFSVDPNQVETAGAGYLSPVTSNATPEGRKINRRVEAVLLTP